ncbi:hypothetical protein SAMN05216259_102246 [Actinacidiphila guanduensis]|uniref:Uncharacterized protein n=1 Tax=Actinacidiphila guanduensis TaxID=310781 RepID=A0A1G9XR68_9ACTN|nr:hypothetical protein SAMN05216259_102246 [Actinacidiphila guanduensis]
MVPVTSKHPGNGSARQAREEQDRLRAAGLRKVAVASVAALAVVLPLAFATASAEHGRAHGGNAGHSSPAAPRTSSDD